MKKMFVFLLIISLFSIPNVFASEKYDDGWHIVVKNDASQRDKEWAQQAKEWAYYENGVEIMRYSKLIGSHRGWGTAPENTLAAFKATREKGYYVFETDVRFTKDNVGVLCHDAKINNVARNNDLSTISGDVLVKDKTLSELKSNYVFNIDRVNHDSPTVLSGYNNNRITTFEEMLDYVKQNKMHVSIELKEGTKEQIESLVRMTQEKNMHNNVRWISFYTDLLKYVKDYDDDEILGINKSSSCDSNHNLYCGEEPEYYLNKLQTDNNVVFMSNNPMKLPSLACAVNLPLNESSYSPSDGVVSTIPQGVVSLNNNSVEFNIGNNENVSYSYDGDGTVKCVSSDSTKLSCSVDANTKVVHVESVNGNAFDGTVTVYATQGITHSASDDTSFRVKVDSEVNLALSHLRNISVDNYDINFNKATTNYSLKIKDENELKINVSLDSNSYKYIIEGNNDLKSGSKILVNIQDLTGRTITTYIIEIEKEETNKAMIVNIPNTFASISNLSTIVALILFIVGFSFIGYGTLIKKK